MLPARAGIHKALLSADFPAPGTTDNIRFLASGDRNGNIQLVEIQPQSPSCSSTGYNFVLLPRN